MPRQRKPPTVKVDRTAALRPRILAVMAAHPQQTGWTPQQLGDHIRCDGYLLGGALKKLTRQGKLLHKEGLPGCPSVYRLPPAESTP